MRAGGGCSAGGASRGGRIIEQSPGSIAAGASWAAVHRRDHCRQPDHSRRQSAEAGGSALGWRNLWALLLGADRLFEGLDPLGALLPPTLRGRMGQLALVADARGSSAARRDVENTSLPTALKEIALREIVASQVAGTWAAAFGRHSVRHRRAEPTTVAPFSALAFRRGGKRARRARWPTCRDGWGGGWACGGRAKASRRAAPYSDLQRPPKSCRWLKRAF